MKKILALYLDTLNEHMEKMLIDMCPDDIDLRFRNPAIGKKGDIKDADVFYVTTFHTSAEVIDAAPNLKLIQRTGVGVDMVDVARAKEKGIPISICKGFNSTSVAELAVLDMLALYRHIVDLDYFTKKKEWHTMTWRHDSYEITGKTVGIIGSGTIGRKVMERVKAFGANIVYYDVFRMKPEDEELLGCKYVSLDELLEEADIISLHVPLLDSTHNMIGKEQIAKMKPNAIIINTARGALVDCDALMEALKAKKIWGAAFDIFEPSEPLFGVDIPNLIVTPHVGAATYDNYYRGYELCISNTLRIMNGEAPLYTI
ncbi:MAG: 2-hydroxyacid dehydrogenase [Eubacteriales bacterium]|nr:2-hydroxyacid dehydrogenase [Eubacteriales bacterium]